MGGGKGGGGGSSTTTTQAKPWEAQRPYLKDMFKQADKLYDKGQLAPAYYSKNTVAPMSSATNTALALQEKRAKAGSPAMTAAQNQLTQTMSGNYLKTNPFANDTGGQAQLSAWNSDSNKQLDAMVKRAVGQSNAGVASNFAAAGRYGSGAFATAANDAAGNISTQMYGQAYDQDQNRKLSAWDSDQSRRLEAYNSAKDRYLNAYTNERDNQMKGMMFAPDLAAADYRDIAALSEVGTARENYEQQKINADMERYNYNASRRELALQNYANLIQGNYGMSGTSKASAQGAKSNPLGSALGGAASGASMGAMAGPWGAAIGGVAGGLLGLFGSK